MEELFFAACNSNDVVAAQAIARATNVDLSSYNWGYTALDVAVRAQSIDVLQWLLRQPSLQINQESAFGLTAFAAACSYNKDVECILKLIEAGCNINSPVLYNEYPINILINSPFMGWDKKKTVIEAMIGKGLELDEPKTLYEFITIYDGTSHCLEILHLFLYYNIDVNADGVKALQLAIRYNHFDICDILWDYIADFNMNSSGLLIEAIEKGYRVNELLERVEDDSEANIFENRIALYTIFLSRNANAIEVLNYLWRHFQSCDRINTLTVKVYLCMRALYQNVEAINREVFIRLFHMLFDFAFEVKYDLVDFFDSNLINLYRSLRHFRVDKDVMFQIFYKYLMVTSRISYSQLKTLYEECPTDLFETFFKITIKIKDTIPLNRDKFDHMLFPDLLPSDMDRDAGRVPSLMKLSRNFIRKQFQPDRETMIKEDHAFFRYYNKVNDLDVPKRVKDILLLNVKLL